MSTSSESNDLCQIAIAYLCTNLQTQPPRDLDEVVAPQGGKSDLIYIRNHSDNRGKRLGLELSLQSLSAPLGRPAKDVGFIERLVAHPNTKELAGHVQALESALEKCSTADLIEAGLPDDHLDGNVMPPWQAIVRGRATNEFEQSIKDLLEPLVEAGRRLSVGRSEITNTLDPRFMS